MDITNIRSSLSTVIANYLECQQCRILDRNTERMRNGYICPICGYISEGGRLYFHVNIHILIDLIQESFHSANLGNVTERLYEGDGPQNISVIIFFCTLREALLDNLINHLMKAHKLSADISERLLSDNKFHIQKQDKLFKSLSGIKWKDAIKLLNEESKLNYKKIDDFVVSVVKIRNDFIHDGVKWSINKELSTKCMNNISGLIKLYTELHNSYVHPHYNKNL